MIRLLEGLHELLVPGGAVRRRIEMSGNGSDDGIAHGIEQIVVGHVAWTDELDAGLVEASFHELSHEGPALAGGDENEERVRPGIVRPLQKRREIGRGQRHAQFGDHLASRFDKTLLERVLRVMAGTVVRYHGDDSWAEPNPAVNFTLSPTMSS